MRTALVLTGHMRCWEKVFGNTKEMILDRYDPDVYIATWDNEGYWTSPENDPDGHGIVKSSPKVEFNKVFEAYNPVAMQVFNQEIVSPSFDAYSERMQKLSVQIRAKNIVSQFWMIDKGFSMVPKNNYDAVIRMRPDLILPNGLPEMDPKNFNFIAHTNHEGRGVGDMFQFSNYWSMEVFNQALKDFEGYALLLNRFCPHMIMEKIGERIEALNSSIAIREGIDQVTIGRTIVHPVEKILQHTPHGQYRDWK